MLYRCLKEYIREFSTVVEIRHIFGCLFDDNGPIPIQEEIKLFTDMVKNIQSFTPLFQIRIISIGLKIVGRNQIKEQIELCYQAREICPWVVGFDLVCEEDHNPGIDSCLDILLEYKAKFKARWGEDF